MCSIGAIASALNVSGQESAAQLVSQPLICDGLVREAEDGELYGDFQIISDSRARGGQAINTPFETGHNPRIHYVDFCFTVETPGEYGILANAYGPSPQSDSFYIQVNDFSTEDDDFGYVWDTSQGDTYVEQYVRVRIGPEFRTREQLFFNLESGQHVFRFRIREDWTHLDWLALELFQAATPTPSPTPQPTATPMLQPTITPTSLPALNVGALFLPMFYEAPDIFPTPTPLPTATPALPSCLDQDQEPNNISRDVGDVPICVNVAISGALSLENDLRDAYLLVQEVPGDLELLLTGIPAGNHMTLTLFDAKGDAIITNADETLAKRIVIPNLPPASYYVAVYFNVGLSGSQPYTLTVIK